MKKFIYFFLIILISKSHATATKSSVEYDEFIPADVNVYNNEGILIEKSKFAKKYVAVYLTAKFCGPCKNFTKNLEKYVNKYHKNIEVLCVSLDRYEREYDKYVVSMKSTKFNFLPYFYRPNRQIWELSIKLVGGRGRIPLLVVYDENRKFVEVANDLVEADVNGNKLYTPWIK